MAHRRWWQDPEGADDPARAIDALADEMLAESAMLRRTREHLGVNDTDLAALELVMRAKTGDEPITPTDLRDGLGVTMASVTVMIDRLERRGDMVRQVDPQDRRRRLLTTTAAADDRIGSALLARDEAMTAAVAGMTPAQVDTVVAFLARAADAVQGVAAAR